MITMLILLGHCSTITSKRHDWRTMEGSMYTAQLEAADRAYMIDVIKCMQDELKGLLVDCD